MELGFKLSYLAGKDCSLVSIRFICVYERVWILEVLVWVQILGRAFRGGALLGLLVEDFRVVCEFRVLAYLRSEVDVGYGI